MPDDPSIQAGAITFQGNSATIMAYLARPAGNGPFPAILVCHENRGLTGHIEDVARRVAKAGYVGLAIDLLSRQGGTARVGASQVSGILGNQPVEQMVGDFAAGIEHLKTQPYVDPKFGMTGFCFGGGITWRCAIGIPELRAAVPFYGPTPPLDQIPSIQAAVLGIYAERDTRINSSIPDVEAVMKQNNKTFQYIIYPNTAHAFHNDTGSNYNAEASRDAWAKTIAWFDQYVRA
jgi:carboxymethylenebutenolidase